MNSPDNVAVKIYSATGALVADYWNNVGNNAGLAVTLKTKKIGGLDKFEFSLANNFMEPLYNDMECRFFVDGVHWDTGYATRIPEPDDDSASVVIEGLGYWHKLKNVVVNESYTAQTLDTIVKDIASGYLGSDLRVLYDVAKISTPSVSSIDIEFNDKKLSEVFERLLAIANYDYSTTQYRFFVDKDRYFNFGPISNDIQAALFEGYQYQDPQINRKKDKIINRILAYRTTAADPSAVEYVATYSDADSVANNGTKEEKLTFPDYVNTSTIQGICEGIVAKYKDPLTTLEIQSIPVVAPMEYGFYRLDNKRLAFYRDVAEFESLSDWDSFLSFTTASISTEHVLTNRTSMKLVTAAGSSGEYLENTFSTPVYFPTFFRIYSYRVDAAAAYTVRIFDSFGNTVDIPVGHNNEPTGEWIKYTVKINVETATALLCVDVDASTSGLLRVDIDASTFGNLRVQYLISEGIVNIAKVQIIMDTDAASSGYFDEFAVETNAYKRHELILEEAEYDLTKSRLASLTLGDTADSIIDEVLKGTRSGDVALGVFAKQ